MTRGAFPGEEVSPMAAALVLLAAVALVVGWEVLCLGEVLRADRVRFSRFGEQAVQRLQRKGAAGRARVQGDVWD